ncbi:hypothetical protein BJ741DRAFT_705453 [Chytriomyces cf. hyalinus JEL632]|nr:hypothetical protein BJ741DRAFT_705453 [Chytriomyces cf. hyalinus JEL632]
MDFKETSNEARHEAWNRSDVNLQLKYLLSNVRNQFSAASESRIGDKTNAGLIRLERVLEAAAKQLSSHRTNRSNLPTHDLNWVTFSRVLTKTSKFLHAHAIGHHPRPMSFYEYLDRFLNAEYVGRQLFDLSERILVEFPSLLVVSIVEPERGEVAQLMEAFESHLDSINQADKTSQEQEKCLKDVVLLLMRKRVTSSAQQTNSISRRILITAAISGMIRIAQDSLLWKQCASFDFPDWVISSIPVEFDPANCLQFTPVSSTFKGKYMNQDATVIFLNASSATVGLELLHSPLQNWKQLSESPSVKNLTKLVGASLYSEIGRLFLVCENSTRYPRVPLQEYLATVPDGRSHFRAVVNIFYQVVCALETIHAAGFVHGHVECNSVWVDSEGRTELSNMGMLDIVLALNINSNAYSTDWMSPEQEYALHRRELNLLKSSSDIWSLGSLLYMLISGGKRAFKDTVVKSKRFRVERPLVCDPRLWEITVGCWDQNELKRPSARDLRELLESQFRHLTLQDFHHTSSGCSGAWSIEGFHESFLYILKPPLAKPSTRATISQALTPERDCSFVSFSTQIDFQTNWKSELFQRQEAAALGGDLESQFMVAKMLEEGVQVTKNLNEAIGWYIKAAVSGHAAAQNNLGYLHYQKFVRTKQVWHYQQAASWYFDAASQGFPAAQYNLGLIHYSCPGMFPDDGKAEFWFTVAAAQKFPQAELMLSTLPQQQRRDKKRKFEWFKKVVNSKRCSWADE